MKRSAAVLIVLVVATTAWAASPPAVNAVHPGLFELGFALGEPTGISAKLWFDRTSALEAIAAWTFTQGALELSADYLLTFPDLLKVQSAAFPLFVGIGGLARVSATTTGPAALTIGLRVPLGVLYVFARAPLEISLEVVPGMSLFPATAFMAMGGLAVRYCF